MAFSIHTMDVGKTASYEYLHTATTIEAGTALTLAAGELVKCAATTRPEFIAAGPANEEGIVPVVRVQSYIVFETELSASGGSLHIGDKVTIDADSKRVTATTGSGVAVIVSMDGTAVGSRVCVRF